MNLDWLDWLEECAREDYWFEINGKKSAELLAYIRKLLDVVEAAREAMQGYEYSNTECHRLNDVQAERLLKALAEV